MQGPATIDLFSGAGGPSQGFAQAGFDVRLRVDLDAAAIETYRHNIVGAVGVAESVENVTGRDLLQAAGLESVDVVIGGPSCQGFSTHGRRSGWVREDDPRNYLHKAPRKAPQRPQSVDLRHGERAGPRPDGTDSQVPPQTGLAQMAN